MIVAAHTFRTVYKNFVISEFTSGFPDDVLQPLYTHRVAAQLEILVAHHIEQNQSPRIVDLIPGAQLRNVVTAAVRVIGITCVITLGPAFTKSFLSVEEHEPVTYFWFLLHARQHTPDLDQRCY